MLSDEKQRREYDARGFRGEGGHQQHPHGGAHDFNYDQFFQQFDSFRHHKENHHRQHSDFHFDFGGLFDDDNDFNSFFGDVPHFGHHFAQFDDDFIHNDHMRHHMHGVHNSHHRNAGDPGFHAQGSAEFHQEETFTQGRSKFISIIITDLLTFLFGRSRNTNSRTKWKNIISIWKTSPSCCAKLVKSVNI